MQQAVAYSAYTGIACGRDCVSLSVCGCGELPEKSKANTDMLCGSKRSRQSLASTRDLRARVVRVSVHLF
jgi:hypothetical protein